MEPNEQHVNTEAQRMTLEAMSAQLVHKLNAMICEQEERARSFAEQHHSTLSIPQQQSAPVTEPLKPAPAPNIPPLSKQKNLAPRVRTNWDTEKTPVPEPAIKPRYGESKKEASQDEESNIGLAMIIFSMLGIIMLLRACT